MIPELVKYNKKESTAQHIYIVQKKLVASALYMLKEQVKKAIDEIRPQIQSHGGDVEFVDIEEGIVKVNLKGACAGCPMSQMTVKEGIQSYLKEKIPEVKSVEAVQ